MHFRTLIYAPRKMHKKVEFHWFFKKEYADKKKFHFFRLPVTCSPDKERRNFVTVTKLLIGQLFNKELY